VRLVRTTEDGVEAVEKGMCTKDEIGTTKKVEL